MPYNRAHWNREPALHGRARTASTVPVGARAKSMEAPRTRGTPLRILVVTPSLPYPPIWGFGTRVYHFLRLLNRQHQVSLLTYEEPGEEGKIDALAKVCTSVHTVPRRTGTERQKRLAQLSSAF